MPIRVTNIVLTKSPEDGSKVKVIIKQDHNEFVLCTLDDKNSSQVVDIMFEDEDQVFFRLSGDATVHLTGTEMEDEDDGTDSSVSSYDSIEANMGTVQENKDGNRRSRFDKFRATRRD